MENFPSITHIHIWNIFNILRQQSGKRGELRIGFSQFAYQYPMAWKTKIQTGSGIKNDGTIRRSLDPPIEDQL
jgi:hypothetical protein